MGTQTSEQMWTSSFTSRLPQETPTQVPQKRQPKGPHQSNILLTELSNTLLFIFSKTAVLTNAVDQGVWDKRERGRG